MLKTAGEILANMLSGKPGTIEELEKAIQNQLSDSSLQKPMVTIDEKFVNAGHKPENRECDHSHYSFEKHGRYCTCGTVMMDFGD